MDHTMNGLFGRFGQVNWLVPSGYGHRGRGQRGIWRIISRNIYNIVFLLVDQICRDN
jgi:hypothetical protein